MTLANSTLVRVSELLMKEGRVWAILCAKRLSCSPIYTRNMPITADLVFATASAAANDWTTSLFMRDGHGRDHWGGYRASRTAMNYSCGTRPPLPPGTDILRGREPLKLKRSTDSLGLQDIHSRLCPFHPAPLSCCFQHVHLGAFASNHRTISFLYVHWIPVYGDADLPLANPRLLDATIPKKKKKAVFEGLHCG
ncbi:uncharacterized protein ARMOST_20622 [Armillaria ostoyae]|uniref:Uncharacterized protein n=1 Tax=Armillaria ostoyae TaxID=47428 RepID=A0A284S7Y8_ARMOS|nr:uncharacterized protein ARMOST_20622 [Armillaria ostoyae]